MPAVDDFRLVAKNDWREPSGAYTPYEGMSEEFIANMRGIGTAAFESLVPVEVPVTLDSQVLPPLAVERAQLERHLRRPMPHAATREELLAYALRTQAGSLSEDEAGAPVWAINDPGETSLTAALALIRDTTVATVRGRGIPLDKAWDDAASIADVGLVTNVAYAGPGFAGLFNGAGRLTQTPFGSSWRVAGAPNPGGFSLGGIYFAIKLDRGSRGVSEWVLPLHPPATPSGSATSGCDSSS